MQDYHKKKIQKVQKSFCKTDNCALKIRYHKKNFYPAYRTQKKHGNLLKLHLALF